MAAGVFQRLGISPDGTYVVFEVTADFSIVADQLRDLLPADEKGIFSIRADGTELRRLAPASREPAFRFVLDATGPFGVRAEFAYRFAFSPDGDAIAYTDRGIGRGEEDATQVFILELRTGDRKALTKLPPLENEPHRPAVAYPTFLDDGRIAFTKDVVDEAPKVQIVSTDGSGRVLDLPPLELVEDVEQSIISPIFRVTGSKSRAALLRPPAQSYFELYYVDEKVSPDGNSVSDYLQLTDFRRQDTSPGRITADGTRAIFAASADPYGQNPSENCQLFSVSVLGGPPTQLTRFDPARHSDFGCRLDDGTGGCFVQLVAYDANNDAVIFRSTCDPAGGVLSGGEFFAIHTDGSGLTRLTSTRGGVAGPDGEFALVELPGPLVFP